MFNILQIYLQVAMLGLFVLIRYMYRYWCTFIIITTVVCNTTCITSAPGRAKCPADPHARRRPKREAEGREPAAAGHGDRGAILAGAAVSPPGPQRIIAQMLRACGIQLQVQVTKYSNNI